MSKLLNADDLYKIGDEASKTVKGKLLETLNGWEDSSFDNDANPSIGFGYDDEDGTYEYVAWIVPITDDESDSIKFESTIDEMKSGYGSEIKSSDFYQLVDEINYGFVSASDSEIQSINDRLTNMAKSVAIMLVNIEDDNTRIIEATEDNIDEAVKLLTAAVDNIEAGIEIEEAKTYTSDDVEDLEIELAEAEADLRHLKKLGYKDEIEAQEEVCANIEIALNEAKANMVEESSNTNKWYLEDLDNNEVIEGTVYNSKKEAEDAKSEVAAQRAIQERDLVVVTTDENGNFVEEGITLAPASKPIDWDSLKIDKIKAKIRGEEYFVTSEKELDEKIKKARDEHGAVSVDLYAPIDDDWKWVHSAHYDKVFKALDGNTVEESKSIKGAKNEYGNLIVTDITPEVIDIVIANKDKIAELYNEIADDYTTYSDGLYMLNEVFTDTPKWVETDEDLKEAIKGELSQALSDDDFFIKELLEDLGVTVVEESKSIKGAKNEYGNLIVTDITPEIINIVIANKDKIAELYETTAEDYTTYSDGIYMLNEAFDNTKNEDDLKQAIGQQLKEALGEDSFFVKELLEDLGVTVVEEANSTDITKDDLQKIIDLANENEEFDDTLYNVLEDSDAGGEDRLDIDYLYEWATESRNENDLKYLLKDSGIRLGTYDTSKLSAVDKLRFGDVIKEAKREVSNCCGAEIEQVQDGFGRCSDCGEMAEVEIIEESRVMELDDDQLDEWLLSNDYSLAHDGVTIRDKDNNFVQRISRDNDTDMYYVEESKATDKLVDAVKDVIGEVMAEVGLDTLVDELEDEEDVDIFIEDDEIEGDEELDIELEEEGINESVIEADIKRMKEKLAECKDEAKKPFYEKIISDLELQLKRDNLDHDYLNEASVDSAAVADGIDGDITYKPSKKNRARRPEGIVEEGKTEVINIDGLELSDEVKDAEEKSLKIKSIGDFKIDKVTGKITEDVADIEITFYDGYRAVVKLDDDVMITVFNSADEQVAELDNWDGLEDHVYTMGGSITTSASWVRSVLVEAGLVEEGSTTSTTQQHQFDVDLDKSSGNMTELQKELTENLMSAAGDDWHDFLGDLGDVVILDEADEDRLYEIKNFSTPTEDDEEFVYNLIKKLSDDQLKKITYVDEYIVEKDDDGAEPGGERPSGPTDMSDRGTIEIEEFYYEDSGLTEDEYVDMLVSDLKLDKSKFMEIEADHGSFKIIATTKDGRDIYFEQDGDISNEFGGYGESDLEEPTMLVDDVDITNKVKKQFEDYTGDSNTPIMVWRVDMYNI
jgi:hypothetical protein